MRTQPRILLLILAVLFSQFSAEEALTESILQCSDPGCAVCQSSGDCSQCKSGFYMMSSSCHNCSAIEGCTLCNDGFGCAQCSDAYLQVQNGTTHTCIQNGTCKDPSYNCKVCHSNGCDQCLDNYFKMDYFEPCNSCSSIPGCSFCQDFNGCGQCRPGYLTVANSDSMQTCSSVRQKCECSSPPSHPECPFSFTSTCEPVAVLPANADLMDPNDCALWTWQTTCAQPCSDDSACTDPKPDPGNCQNPVYNCTSMSGGCHWDYSCQDVTGSCTTDTCTCDASTTPLLECQYGVPPTCNCTIAEDGSCSPAYVCPPVEVPVCTTDGCSQCYNASATAPACNYYMIDQCSSQCTSYSTCGVQSDTNTCGWASTDHYKTCMASCTATESPPPPTCVLTDDECTCIANTGCVSVRYTTNVLTSDQTTETYWYQRCLSETDSTAFTNIPGFSIVNSQTPGLRATCTNQPEPSIVNEISQVATFINGNLEVADFQPSLSSFIANAKQSAVVIFTLFASTYDPYTAAVKVSFVILASGDVVKNLTDPATKAAMQDALENSVCDITHVPKSAVTSTMAEILPSTGQKRQVAANSVPSQTYLFSATIASPDSSASSQSSSGNNAIPIVVGVVIAIIVVVVIVIIVIIKREDRLEVV